MGVEMPDRRLSAFVVRVYHVKLTTCMLADGARQGQDGKLYIFGGQWDRIFAPAVPTSHPTMAVVVVVQVEYNEALREHHIELTLRRADGEPAGPKAIARFNVGHPAGLEPGAPVSFPLALEQQGIVFDSYGRFEWLVELDGNEVGRLPITVAPVHNPPSFAEPTTRQPPSN
jgi:hypothetical protein